MTWDVKLRAPNYDKLEWTDREKYMSLLIKSCNLKSNYHVCDVGTGTGKVAYELAKYCSKVTGIDFSDEMLEIAMEKRKKSNIFYENINAEKITYRDDYFDAVVSRMAFHHIDEHEVAIKECVRVLKPGNKFVISEGVPPQGARHFYTEMFKLKEKRRTYTIDDLVELLQYGGLIDIEIRIHKITSVSISNWLVNSGLPKETCDKIYNMHLDCEDYVKKAYNMEIVSGDILMDWTTAIISGVKKH